MKASDLRDLSADELESKSNELRGELFNLKVKHSTGQLEDTARLANLRRDVARCETILRERQEATTE
ncbi:MAG TPA: 50S ribosomal protein L29 [Terrimesophilobacter sp.]|nr:50S ribosomal protein L29 [Terrimesophilobacter sp.]